MVRRIASLGLLALLAGVGPAGAGTPDFKATAHAIAVVSILGNQIDGFGGTHEIPGVDFDAVTQRAIADQIAIDIPGADVRRVDIPFRLLRARMYGATGYGDVGMDATRALLLPWAQSHPVDYIVILRKTVGVMEDRDVGYSMTTKHPFFGMGLYNGRPTAFLNLTVCDGRTLEVVAHMSVRNVDWGSAHYDRLERQPIALDVLAADAAAMLASTVPGLVHGVGL